MNKLKFFFFYSRPILTMFNFFIYSGYHESGERKWTSYDASWIHRLDLFTYLSGKFLLIFRSVWKVQIWPIFLLLNLKNKIFCLKTKTVYPKFWFAVLLENSFYWIKKWLKLGTLNENFDRCLFVIMRKYTKLLM